MRPARLLVFRPGNFRTLREVEERAGDLGVGLELLEDPHFLVERRFASAPGRLESFSWPVTRPQAIRALQHFVRHALPSFGDYQDAMKSGAPWLFHSWLSPDLNLKLLDPRE